MALAIKSAPTLFGEVANKFEQAANQVEKTPGLQDYCKQAKAAHPTNPVEQNSWH